MVSTQAKPGRGQKKQEVVTLVQNCARHVDLTVLPPSSVDWVQKEAREPDEGSPEDKPVLNLWSESWNAMIDKFPPDQYPQLKVGRLNDICRVQLGVKMTQPQIKHLESNAHKWGGGKDMQGMTIQAAIMAVFIACPEAFYFLWDDLKKRFESWGAELGYLSRNPLTLSTRQAHRMSGSNPKNIPELIQRFRQQEGLSETDFINRFTEQRRAAIAEIIDGRIPTDAELFLLGGVIFKPGQGDPGMPERRYELEELQAIRGDTDEDENGNKPETPQGKPNGVRVKK